MQKISDLKINALYKLLDKLYLPRDKQHIRRTRNIRLIPFENNRRGGKYSYAEWAHVIGIFQTLMYIHLDKKENNTILDVGCGTGLVGIASEPFLGDQGHYVGIDVIEHDIEFCRRHYPSRKFEFIHVEANNPAYAPSQTQTRPSWDFEPGRFDFAVALSVWTHLNENDAVFYMQELNRVLKPGGKAIVTFFLLDETYMGSLPGRSTEPGKFHMTPQNLWVFDKPAYGSSNWFSPAWTNVPEEAIGVTAQGIEQLLSGSRFKLIAQYQGNWKEVPGIFFQDILVLQKQG